MKRIESPQNTLVKTIRRLAQPGKREDKFLLEGRKLVDAATATVHGRAQIETVVVSSTFSGTVPEGVPAMELPERLFRSVSHLDSPDGILAVAERPSRGELPDRGLLVVCAGIQDPGNLGAIVRVAEAAGVSALVTLPDSADPYGPKAVRGSMGSVLRLPIFELDPPLSSMLSKRSGGSALQPSSLGTGSTIEKRTTRCRWPSCSDAKAPVWTHRCSPTRISRSPFRCWARWSR